VLEILNNAIQSLSLQLSAVDEIIKTGNGPPLGAVFDTISPVDLANIEKLYHAEFSAGKREKQEEDQDSSAEQRDDIDLSKISGRRQKLINRFDKILQEVSFI
jgi:hypothetical protein